MKHFFLFILLIGFTSCATINFLTIETKEPAAITFPPEVKNILIVDNSISDTTEPEEGTDLSIMSNDSAKTVMLNSLKQFMSEEKYFDNVEIYLEKIREDTLSETRPLTQSKVRALSGKNKADAIISLDLYMVSAGIESSNVYYFADYSLLSAHVGSILRVYESNGTMLSPPVVCIDSLFLEGSENWSRRKNNIQEMNGLVSEISVKVADNLTSAFVPSWKTQQRWFYSDNSSEMKAAAAYVTEGKWEEAADIWGILYDKENNDKKKLKLASNLALANEYLDNIDHALDWINLAFELIPNKSKSEEAILTVKYRNSLIDRKEVRAKLFEQLGLESIEDNSEIEEE